MSTCKYSYEVDDRPHNMGTSQNVLYGCNAAFQNRVHEQFPYNIPNTNMHIHNDGHVQAAVLVAAASPPWRGWKMPLPQHGLDVLEGVCTETD